MNIVCPRCRGYTLLELMISLVLMATLMLVAWAILDSYRNAEMRAWNQAYQMQVMRIAREWLESDAACLMEPRTPGVSSASPTDALPASDWQGFRGDSQGFEVDLIPSVDPLAWLQSVTRAEEPLSTTTPPPEAMNPNPGGATDPLAVHRLRYRFVDSDTASDDALELVDLQRELVPRNRWSKVAPANASEKLLGAADLYRTSDDALPPDAAGPTNQRTESIRNLVSPQFRYSDGSEWSSQWDSQLQGSLPRAIELSFDLPSAATDYERLDPEAGEAEPLGTEDFASEASQAEDVLSMETSAAGQTQARQRDVRIVVFVAGSAASGGSDE